MYGFALHSSFTFQEHGWLILAFFVVAMIYASVGFGGGSSYLALLSLTGIAFVEFRAIALLCNIIVVSGGTYLFVKNKLLDWKKVLPLVVLSVPMAFLGGFLKIDQQFFFIILAITLIIASLLMLFVKKGYVKKDHQKNSIITNGLYGGFIGFISGMVGIGGGVFLAPLLHLTKWDTVKKIAAASSFFILVNSISGLIGQVQNPDFKIDLQVVLIFMVSVFAGGQIGSRMSIKILKPEVIKFITALLIGFVGIKLLLQQL